MMYPPEITAMTQWTMADCPLVCLEGISIASILAVDGPTPWDRPRGTGRSFPKGRSEAEAFNIGPHELGGFLLEMAGKCLE